MKLPRRATTVAAALVLVSAGGIAGAAPASAAGCGRVIGPQIHYPTDDRFTITVGFSDATRAVAYDFTTYVSVKNNGKTKRHVQRHVGTLRLRSGWKKTLVYTLPDGETDITAAFLGAYSLLGRKELGCVVNGYQSGGTTS